MGKSTKETIECKAIKIKGSLRRHEVVRKVINAFIDAEYNKKGKGVNFIYPVENIGTDRIIYISRPGHKKNFDFKVLVTKSHGVGEGSHDEICKAVRRLRYSSKKKFNLFWETLIKI